MGERKRGGEKEEEKGKKGQRAKRQIGSFCLYASRVRVLKCRLA